MEVVSAPSGSELAPASSSEFSETELDIIREAEGMVS